MSRNPKQAAAEHAASFVQDGMVVGLGTGSTAAFAIRKLAEGVQSGLSIRGIPTSVASQELAEKLGIPLTDFTQVQSIDVTIDGADEVDDAFVLVKGGGGALLREKIVASATRHQIIIVDESKWKRPIGAFPLPVEVVGFGWPLTQARLRSLGPRVTLRQAGGQPFQTDNGNYILDCAFGRIEDPADLEARIKSLPGVVECGLFVGLAHRVITGKADGSVDVRVLTGN